MSEVCVVGPKTKTVHHCAPMRANCSVPLHPIDSNAFEGTLAVTHLSPLQLAEATIQLRHLTQAAISPSFAGIGCRDCSSKYVRMLDRLPTGLIRGLGHEPKLTAWVKNIDEADKLHSEATKKLWFLACRMSLSFGTTLCWLPFSATS